MDSLPKDLPPLPPGYEGLMPRHAEPPLLHSVGKDTSGRDASLTPEAAQAWESMKECARTEGIALVLVSSFRSVERQRAIVLGKVEAGAPLAEILKVSAYPGFSEHHSGRAVDLGAPGCEDLTEQFEGTREFAWLLVNARRFGFALTYPRGNPFGIAYEPWHWCFDGGSAQGARPGKGSHG